MIVLNGNHVLNECLKSIYPYAHKIIVCEGAVEYFVEQEGITTSSDGTNETLESFTDPENKLIVIHGCAKEKTELCKKWFAHVPEETTHVWCIDSDEIFKSEHIEQIIEILKTNNPESVSFKSRTFFGGFEHTLNGFERNVDFKRLLRYEPHCEYSEHRPPTLSCEDKNGVHLSGNHLFTVYGIEMYHYSYSDIQVVHNKTTYYKRAVSKENCIDNYFNDVYLKWVFGNESQRAEIEHKYNGVHEFKPEYRGDCRTEMFTGEHPEEIKKSMDRLIAKHKEQKQMFLLPFCKQIVKPESK